MLRVKGSGSDLRTIRRPDFPGVRLDDVLPLLERDAMSDEEMVAYLAHTLMEPASPRPSIETLLHAFLPARFVVHTHADAILALTNTPSGRRWVTAALGPGAIWVDYRRPGFGLSKQVASAFRVLSRATSIVLEKHGLITWGDSGPRSLRGHRRAGQPRRSLRPAAPRRRREATPPPRRPPASTGARPAPLRAVAPLLRGLAGRTPRTARCCPPTKTMEVPPAGRVLPALRRRRGRPGLRLRPPGRRASPRSAPPLPITWSAPARTALYVPCPGATASASDGHPPARGRLEAGPSSRPGRPGRRTTCATRGRDGKGNARAPERSTPARGSSCSPAWAWSPSAGTPGRPASRRTSTTTPWPPSATPRRWRAYASLDEQECFDVEYWPLEMYKLTLAAARKPSSPARSSSSPEQPTGSAGPSPSASAPDGASVVVSDVNGEGARTVADTLNERFGAGRAIAVRTDVVRQADVSATFDATVLAFGGLDVLVSNAGIAPFSAIDRTELADWQRSLTSTPPVISSSPGRPSAC